MFKPIIYCDWANPDLGIYDREVSISIDCVIPNLKHDYNIFLQMEPDSISGIKSQLLKYKYQYDLILCWDNELLNLYNSELFPFGTCWIQNAELRRKNKTLSVSYITSRKSVTPNHRLRNEIYNRLPTLYKNLKIKKHISPPRIENKLEMLETFKYSIIIENETSENWFTEKIIDCFVTDTIPIYLGCPNLNMFFNENGVLRFNDHDSLMRILENISQHDVYNELCDIIEDNHVRALEYMDIWERLKRRINKI